MSSQNILVIDDEPDIRNLVQEILEDEGYQVSSAENAESARLARSQQKPDLILLDIWMPDTDGISLLKEWSNEATLDCPVVMMSGHGTVETAVEATRLGAYDYIEKPISLAKLLLIVERALETSKLRRENQGLKRQDLDEPQGKSQVMQKLREQARRVAQHTAWVLITGAAGTGKKSFARYIHNHSTRADGPFVEVSAGMLSKERSDSELFGYVSDGEVHYGRLEQANHGTLFIDEVTDLDLPTQLRLLGALNQQEFQRLGGSGENVKVDVRVVAATRKNLREEVRLGRFREELYYQLNVVPLNLPSLVEHCEDVPDLLEFYANYFVENDNLPYRHFSVAAQNTLRNYSWPGNIRELKNLVQRLLILGSEETISQEEIEKHLGGPITPAALTGDSNTFTGMPLREAREEFERQYLTTLLEEVGGAVGELAKRSGMERTNLYRKLKSLGIDPKETAGK